MFMSVRKPTSGQMLKKKKASSFIESSRARRLSASSVLQLQLVWSCASLVQSPKLLWVYDSHSQVMSEESILPHPAVLIFFPLLLLRCSLSLNEEGGQLLVSCLWLSSEYLILRTVTSYAILSWLLPTPKWVLARIGRDTRLQVYFLRLTRTSLMFLKMFILFLT